VFDPVVIAGTKVQHASLHNADEIARKDTRVGDTVVIFKAGDIIPQIERVIKELRPKNSRPFDMAAELKRQFPELEFARPAGEAVYRALGTAGGLLLRRAITHFASRAALDIATLGEKTATVLVEAGLVKDIADIYALTKNQVAGLERFAATSAEKLVGAIQAKKNPPLSRFIYGLGIRHIGAQTAIDLANHFRRLDNLGSASLPDLRAVEGVGDIVAESILVWFAEEDNQKLLAKFRYSGVWPQDALPASGSLAGQKIAITGALKSMGRSEAAEKIRSLGGVFQTSVGRDTDYLVVGASVGAAKLAKAARLGTRQINEAEFTRLLTGYGRLHS
jgi:DNA ligase (NAD+)